MKGRNFSLHPVQRNSTDPVVKQATVINSNGNFIVPARTTAVFVAGVTTSATMPQKGAGVIHGWWDAFLCFGFFRFFNL